MYHPTLQYVPPLVFGSSEYNIFKYNFMKENFFYFDLNFTHCVTLYWLRCWTAITWINDNPVHWCIFMLPGLNELTHCGLATPFGDIDLGQHWLR